MHTLKQIFKVTALKQLAIVFLAGLLLLVSVACSNTRAAVPGNGSRSTSNTSQSMYPHKDNLRDTQATQAKVDRTIKQVDQRLQKVQNPRDYLNEITPDKSPKQQAKEIGRTAEKTAKKAGESIQRAAQDVDGNTQTGLSNLKKNTQQAIDHVVNDIEKAPNPVR